jgi:hypothetical protein
MSRHRFLVLLAWCAVGAEPARAAQVLNVCFEQFQG